MPLDAEISDTENQVGDHSMQRRAWMKNSGRAGFS